MKPYVNFYDVKEEESKDLVAGVYIRVSILTQVKHGAGIDIQEEQCRKYCKYKNIKIHKIYSDEAVTGRSKYDERKGLFNLMEDAKDGKFNAVVIYALDRVGRNLLMIGNTIKEMQEDLGLEVFSCVEDLELSTEEGKLSMFMFAWVSHLELTNIRARLDQGLKTRRAKDGYIGGPLVYGYCRMNNRIDIHEKHSEIVRWIYGLYHFNNFSMCKIAELLTQYKILTPKNKKVWNGNTIKYILNNYKKYLGRETINGNLNNICWPCILNSDFEVLNDDIKLKRNNKNNKKNQEK